VKRGIYAPALVLIALFAASLWNGVELSRRARRLLEDIDRAQAQAASGQWEQTVRTMERGYEDWSAQRTYLHSVSRHDASDGAGALYRRCILYARAADGLHFFAELELLREQLETLPEMERLSLGNIL